MNRAVKVGLILLGIWFCYLAFTFVRHLAWWLLWHVGEVAALIAAAGVVWVFRKLGAGKPEKKRGL